MRFRVDAPDATDSSATSHAASSSGRLTAAAGRLAEVGPHHLELEGGFALRFELPRSVDLSSLVGSQIKLALRDEHAAGGPIAQTLVISDERAVPRLIARFGPAGSAHTVGRWRVRATLSRRPNGPLAFGTDRLQYVMHVGDTVLVHDGSEEFFVSFVDRSPLDYVSYVIAERSVWREERAPLPRASSPAAHIRIS
jgi:hypothetical protein